LTAHERFCIDEAALLVLSYAKRDAAEEARLEAELEAKDGGKGKAKGKGKKKPKVKAPDDEGQEAQRVNDAAGFDRLKEQAARAQQKVFRKAMMR